MAGSFTTKTIKDGLGASVSVRTWDESGAGSGPFAFAPKVGNLVLLDLTLSLDTSAYASGDVLADTQELTNAVRINDSTGILHSVLLIDQDDQGAALDLYFLSANNTMGTENSAPSISDANATAICARVQIATSDYYDLGGVRVADVHGLNRIVKGASGSTSIYVAAVNGSGTPTYTASGIKLRIGILQD